MIILKTKSGHPYKTMTVGEVIELLSKFDESLPILATWEGIYCAIDESTFAKEPHGLLADCPDAVIANVG